MRDRKRWRALAEQASKEQDPKKLSELVQELNRRCKRRKIDFASTSLALPKAE